MRAPSSRVTGSILPDAVSRALNDAANESPKPDDPAFANTEFRLIARPADAFGLLQCKRSAAGYECILLGDRLRAKHRRRSRTRGAGARPEAAGPARRDPLRRRTHGYNSRQRPWRTEPGICAGACQPSRRHHGIAALAADTDGTDGGAGSADDPAGAMWTQIPPAAPAPLGLDPAAFLRNNDSTAFFARLGTWS